MPVPLQQNIIRESHKKEKFNERYEIVKQLGKGSMGEVCLVKLRENAIGGSAFQDRQKQFRIGGLYFHKRNIPFFDEDDHHNHDHDNHHLAQTERRRCDVVYALKTIQLNLIENANFVRELKNEIDILKAIDHPNIVKAYEVYYHDDSQIYLVMEACCGGDLYTRSPYTEHGTQRIAQELLSAIKFMHEHGIVHRDLKFENILFENSKPTAAVKIIDFGLSKKFLPGQIERQKMTNFCGSLYTMAPQVITKQKYTSQADLWSFGVIIYMLLSSRRPFNKKKRKNLERQIMNGDYYDMDGNCKIVEYNMAWDVISEPAKDFVKSLLVVDEKKRFNASAASRHPWLTKEILLVEDKSAEDCSNDSALAVEAVERVSVNTLQKVGFSLLQYRQTSALKRIALNVIAHNSTSDEIFKLRRVFESYDTSRDGIINFEELKDALNETNFSTALIQEIFKSIDVNDNGHINYTEFLAATLEAHGQIEEERIAEAFNRIDIHDTGYIHCEELEHLLGKNNFRKKDIREMLREVDENHDGKISYNEFLKLFRHQRDIVITNELGTTDTSFDMSYDEDLG